MGVAREQVPRRAVVGVVGEDARGVPYHLSSDFKSPQGAMDTLCESADQGVDSGVWLAVEDGGWVRASHIVYLRWA